MRLKPPARLALTAALFGFSCNNAVAQDAADPAADALDTIPVEPATPAAATPQRERERASAAVQLEEVLVTARRRQERAQDVPISLAVLDGDDLANAGLFRPQDIQQRTPGMTVSVPNARLTSYTIRGLGSSSQNDGMESSVGLFLDGVYLGRQGLSMFDLVDLDRVEVLRGPQGTLFGKNTTAGALNIVTKLPAEYFEAQAEASIGDSGFRQLRGSLTGPLIGGLLAGRLTAYSTDKDGQIENRYDGKELNNQNRQGLRGQLLWTQTDTLSGRLIAEYGHQSEDCCVYPLIIYRDAVRARDEYMEYTRAPIDPYQRQTDSDTRTHSEVEQKAISAEFNWNVSDAHRLTSISAYRDWSFKPYSDDATSLKLVPETGVANTHRQFSEEIRLASQFDDFDSVLGLFYLYQHLEGHERNIFGEDLVGWTFGGLIRQNVLPFATVSNTGPLLYALIPPEALDGMTVLTDTYQKSHSAAAFGSVDWHLSEQLDLTTGLRYTHEWKDAGVTRSRSGGCASCSPLQLTNVLSDALAQALGVDISALSYDGLIDSVAGGDYARYNQRDEGNYSGQIALSYHPLRNVLTYASIARGYKGGGINLGATGDTVKPTFKPEEATSYELGVKSQLFDRALSVSFAAYQTDVKNYQALTFDEEQTLIPNPRQLNLLNVGKVRLRGAELDAYGYAMAGLMLRAGAAYNQAITLSFPNAPDEDTRDNTKDLSGETLYNAPRWTATTGFEYSHATLNRIDGYLGVDYYYRSGAWATVEHGRGSYINAYELTNARIGLRSATRSWDVSAFVRNLFDENYLGAVYALYGVGDYGGTAGDERSYGLTVRVAFD
ncbi:MAG: putative TonB-dependent siderophore receptor [Hydrocarboniphaga sp.]|uniref:TonB-dependent receptor n=1 Tax=Hydrocarboniphaga sp. TaxID=2033016 RepID=UPI002638E229|nr:TonB-dependent receptor [Hydrocarboniphaga sp.]MDB5970784.1 putative TonB-dependent siderophore receptor [Hydrocarboniphaga sp.]